MRYFIILLFSISIYGESYDFDEYKFVHAANQEFKKSGNIAVDGKKTTITYIKPQYKQIINNDGNVSIKGSSGKVYTLKGKALFYTKMFINLMTSIDSFDELKPSKDFDIKKDKENYTLVFKGDLEDQISKAIVRTQNSKVLSFKLFMINDDTLEIIKK